MLLMKEISEDSCLMDSLHFNILDASLFGAHGSIDFIVPLKLLTGKVGPYI